MVTIIGQNEMAIVTQGNYTAYVFPTRRGALEVQILNPDGSTAYTFLTFHISKVTEYLTALINIDRENY